MTMLLSAFGLLGRFAGDLLTSALSWASSLLFGRVPRSRQIFLTLMMAGSFLWLLVAVGLILPGVAVWLFSATPHPASIRLAWLVTALIVCLVALPPAVGLAGVLVPGDGERPQGLAVAREILRGYLLAPVIAGLLIFLGGVGVARKIRSARHGWADLHVPIVAKGDGYDQLVADLHDAVAGVDLPTTVELAPRVLTLPALVLTSVASSNVRNLRPERLVELKGQDLRIGVYPSDIAISGTAASRVRARAAILSRLATTSAHLTTTAEAQAVEDRLQALAEAQPQDGGGVGRQRVADAFRDVDAVLLDLQVPPEEWDILYRLRLQMERDLLAGDVPGTTVPGRAAGALDGAAPVPRASSARLDGSRRAAAGTAGGRS